MGSNAALDVAIALVLMYLVLSLIATIINEIIATFFALRAANLAGAIGQIIDVPVLKADFYNHGLVAGTRDAVGKHVSYMSGDTFALALLASLDPTKPLPGFADIKGAVENLPDSNIRDVLLAQVAAAGTDLAALRKNVSSWFDTAMDRVSGTYKRNTKVISLIVGILIAGIMNADTISVAKHLWGDGAVRAEMVQAADTIVQKELARTAGEGAGTTPPQASSSIGGAAGTAPPPVHQTKREKSPSPLVTQATSAIANATDALRPLPIGWPLHVQQSGGLGAVVLFWLVTLGGWLMTGLAISLGAPFWFDLLSKFMNIRGTGPKPETSGTDA